MKIGSFFIEATATVVLFCAGWTTVAASIVESNSFKAIASQADNRSLVLVNITNTLYASENTMGDSLWKDYFSERVYALVQDKEKAEALINQTKNKIVNAVPKKLVEPDTAAIISQLQDKKIPILGFTTKHPSRPYEENFADLVNKSLVELGIHLENSKAFITVNAGEHPTYHYLYGIIFTSGNPKGEALITFLENINGTKPKRILMIDTSDKNLTEVQTSLQGTPYTFLGFHYTRPDSRSNHFDQDIGTIEFLEFMSKGVVISDQEALHIKHHNSTEDYTQALDAYIKEKTK